MKNLEQHARERFEFNRQKQTLKEQQEQRLSVTYRNGLFKVNMTLLTFLYMKNVNTGIFKHDPEFIMLDSYDTPIKVHCEELSNLCMERWREVYNDWYNEYEELKTKRRVKDVGV